MRHTIMLTGGTNLLGRSWHPTHGSTSSATRAPVSKKRELLNNQQRTADQIIHLTLHPSLFTQRYRFTTLQHCKVSLLLMEKSHSV